MLSIEISNLTVFQFKPTTEFNFHSKLNYHFTQYLSIDLRRKIYFCFFFFFHLLSILFIIFSFVFLPHFYIFALIFESSTSQAQHLFKNISFQLERCKLQTAIVHINTLSEEAKNTAKGSNIIYIYSYSSIFHQFRLNHQNITFFASHLHLIYKLKSQLLCNSFKTLFHLPTSCFILSLLFIIIFSYRNLFHFSQSLSSSLS